MLFKCGVIADVQHADAPNGWDFHRVNLRYYRESLDSLVSACSMFDEQDVDVVLQLGDVLDGKAIDSPQESLNRVLAPLRQLACPTLHCLGNHELYLFTEGEASRLLETPSWHYSYCPHPGWKIVVLNTYAFSALNPATSEAAFQFLEKRNPNDVRGQADWLAGLSGKDQRFLPFNGSVDAAQLDWLRSELDCEANVIVMGHIPVGPGSTDDKTLLWNYDEVLDVLHQAKAQVRAYLAGHDHIGGYAVDQAGIHHVTFQSPMLCRGFGHDKAHAIMNVYDDRIELHGFGTVDSRTLQFSENKM